MSREVGGPESPPPTKLSFLLLGRISHTHQRNNIQLNSERYHYKEAKWPTASQSLDSCIKMYFKGQKSLWSIALFSS